MLSILADGASTGVPMELFSSEWWQGVFIEMTRPLVAILMTGVLLSVSSLIAFWKFRSGDFGNVVTMYVLSRMKRRLFYWTLAHTQAKDVWFESIQSLRLINREKNEATHRPEFPLLGFDTDSGDADIIFDSVTNYLSADHETGGLMASRGLPVLVHRLVYGITFQQYSRRKLRVVGIWVEDIPSILLEEHKWTNLAHRPSSRKRINSLKLIASIYVLNHWDIIEPTLRADIDPVDLLAAAEEITKPHLTKFDPNKKKTWVRSVNIAFPELIPAGQGINNPSDNWGIVVPHDRELGAA